MAEIERVVWPAARWPKIKSTAMIVTNYRYYQSINIVLASFRPLPHECHKKYSILYEFAYNQIAP